MTDIDTPAPPAGLEAAGRRLWCGVVEKFNLNAAELAMLAAACATSDELARLELELHDLPTLITSGSAGQVASHPLLQDLRGHRALLAKLTAELRVPDEDERAGFSSGARHAQKAARARWGLQKLDLKEDANGDASQTG